MPVLSMMQGDFASALDHQLPGLGLVPEDPWSLPASSFVIQLEQFLLSLAETRSTNRSVLVISAGIGDRPTRAQNLLLPPSGR